MESIHMSMHGVSIHWFVAKNSAREGLISVSVFYHYDATQWKRFLRHGPFVREIHRSPLDSPHKGPVTWTLMFPLMLAETNCWINHRVAGDSGRHDAHFDVIFMPDRCLQLAAVRGAVTADGGQGAGHPAGDAAAAAGTGPGETGLREGDGTRQGQVSWETDEGLPAYWLDDGRSPEVSTGSVLVERRWWQCCVYPMSENIKWSIWNKIIRCDI